VKTTAILIFLLLMTGSICRAQHQEGWVDDYQGVLGNHKIRISLIVVGSDVSGEYFYLRWLKNIPFKGKIEGRKIVLNELDEKGKVVAVFDGHFPEYAPEYLNEPIKFEVIEGEWFRPDGAERKRFRLVLEDSVGLMGDNRYSVAGFNDDKVVETAAQKFKNAVIVQDKRKVASLVNYPISVKIEDKTVVIKKREDFIKMYNKIFNRPIFDQIKESVPHNMFAKADGVMLGDHGEIWIGSINGKAKIIAINK